MKVRKELKRVGVDKNDASELEKLALDISNSAGDIPNISEDAKNSIRDSIGITKPSFFAMHTTKLAYSSFAVLIIGVIILAQFSKPSSPIYRIKEATDDVRSLVQPDYQPKEKVKFQGDDSDVDDSGHDDFDDSGHDDFDDDRSDNSGHGSDDSDDSFDDSDFRTIDDNSGHGSSNDASDDDHRDSRDDDLDSDSGSHKSDDEPEDKD